MLTDPACQIVELQHRVDRMLLRGAGLTAIEELIDRTTLDSEQKSALWLYAWSHLPRRVQRRESEAMLAIFAGD